MAEVSVDSLLQHGKPVSCLRGLSFLVPEGFDHYLVRHGLVSFLEDRMLIGETEGAYDVVSSEEEHVDLVSICGSLEASLNHETRLSVVALETVVEFKASALTVTRLE